METNKREIDKQLLIEFQESVLYKFKSLCEKDGITPDFYTLIDFLFQTNIIKDLTIAKFMVMELYPAALFENATCVAVQLLTMQVRVLKVPPVPHVAIPPPE